VELVEQEICGNRFAEHYKKEIRKSIQLFFSWAVKRSKGDMRTMTKKDLIQYHQYLERMTSKKTGEPLNSVTINRRFYAVKLVFTVLYRAELLTENPMQGLHLKLPEKQGLRRRPLSVDEIMKFLETIPTDSKQGLKDRTIFELIYSSGLRVSEAANLMIGDIDFEKREMIVRGKYDRDRVVPISKVARDFLVLYLEQRINNPDDPVFVSFRGTRSNKGKFKSDSISERFRTLLKRYGMDKKEISAHSIRHSTATHLLDNGASIRHVQELLGHKEIQTTVRYTHIQTDGIAKIYRKYHPREHELFETVDSDYVRHFEKLLEE